MDQGYVKCIIAFLDILGFKRIVESNQFETVRNIFQEIVNKDELKGIPKCANANDEMSDKEQELNNYNEALRQVQIKVMSDSIVISTPDKHPECLAAIVDICDELQQRLLCLDSQILLRGAIAVGDFFSDGNILFGKGLVDAYVAQEYYAVYPRVIISENVISGRKASISGKELPQDDDKYYRIDSIERYLDVEEIGTWAELKNSERYIKLNGLIRQSLSCYDSDRVRQKYLWLDKLLFKIRQQIDLNNGTITLPQ